MKKLNRLIGALLVSLVLIGVTMATLNQIHAAPVEKPGAAAVQVVNLNTASVTQTTTFAGGRWAALGTENPPAKAEIWLMLDIGTVNTTTVGLQISPDNSTWVDHATSSTIGSSLVTDTTKYVTATIEGVYYRLVATTTNSNAVTPVLKVVLR